MPDLNDVPRGTIPATADSVEAPRFVRPGSAAYRTAAEQARAILAAQERDRRARRDARWSELAEQLLDTMRARILTEEQLFLASYAVVRGDRTAALATPDALALREVTRRVWLAQDPGESQVPGHRSGRGIEEAATAGDCSPSSGTGATAVVSAARHTARSSSPAVPDLLVQPLPIGADGRPDYFAIGAKLARAESAMLPVDPAPATCCDTPRIVTITCPKCEGDAYRPVRVSVGDPPEDAECPRCEGTGTILACDTCDTEVAA